MTQAQTYKQDTNDRRRSRAKATAGAVGAALAVWAVARFVLGIEIASPEFGPDRPSKTVGAVHVAGTALVASAAGWGLLAALERFTARARTIWTVIAAGVLAFSLGGPFGGQGITTANQLALLAMHLAIGATLIPKLRATSNPTATSVRPATKRRQLPVFRRLTSTAPSRHQERSTRESVHPGQTGLPAR